MGTVASQITSFTIVYTTVYPDADQSKHQSSTSLAFVWGIHRGPVNSPHKWPVTRKMFPFDDVIMWCIACCFLSDAFQLKLLWWTIGSGNGLLPDGTKPLPEPLLTYHQKRNSGVITNLRAISWDMLMILTHNMHYTFKIIIMSSRD